MKRKESFKYMWLHFKLNAICDEWNERNNIGVVGWMSARAKERDSEEKNRRSLLTSYWFFDVWSMQRMDSQLEECVNLCSVESDILDQMNKERKEMRFLFFLLPSPSPLFLSLENTREREKRTSSINDLLCLRSIHGVINFLMMSVTTRSSRVSGSHIYTDEK